MFGAAAERIKIVFCDPEFQSLQVLPPHFHHITFTKSDQTHRQG